MHPFLSVEDRVRLVQAAGGEEALAEKIITYARGGQGFSGRAKRIVERLFRVLRRYFGTPAAQDKVRDFYDQLLGGGFASREAQGFAGQPAAAYRKVGGEVHPKYGDTDPLGKGGVDHRRLTSVQGVAQQRTESAWHPSSVKPRCSAELGRPRQQPVTGKDFRTHLKGYDHAAIERPK
jgi:hypothetical protein